jgi:serine phosphatase RsbU (regulator of sigma subunit)
VQVVNGPPLAAVEQPTYAEVEVEAPVGATVVFYTDGLFERRGEPLTAGLARLEAIARHGPRDPEALADHLLDELLPLEGVQDDAALLVVGLDA